MGNNTNFIHLSDIHFKYQISGKVYDLDDDIRNELKIDAKKLTEAIGKVNGLLVTGDIAFAGKQEEYETAGAWLSGLCAEVGCREENIWTVPGNHDVDRGKTKETRIIKDVHQKIRGISLEKLDDELRGYFYDDPQTPKVLFTPLENYNEFVSKYKCSLEPLFPIWKHKLKLNDGSTLCLVGLNSTLISNEKDDDGANKLVLGEAQLNLQREEGVEYLTLCHHPPQWLRDQDNVETKLNQRARIQLFGHKHSQNTQEINRKSIRIIAGALHPDRNEGSWIPAYNILTLSATKENSDRLLVVKVYERVWNPETLSFVPGLSAEGSDHKTYSLKLDDWVPQIENQVPKQKGEKEPASTQSKQLEIKEDFNEMDCYRRLTYRFLQLPYNIQIKIAQKLELLADDDKGVKDWELYERFFRRAKEKEILWNLWNNVEEAHGEQPSSANPFKNE